MTKKSILKRTKAWLVSILNLNLYQNGNIFKCFFQKVFISLKKPYEFGLLKMLHAAVNFDPSLDVHQTNLLDDQYKLN